MWSNRRKDIYGETTHAYCTDPIATQLVLAWFHSLPVLLLCLQMATGLTYETSYIKYPVKWTKLQRCFALTILKAKPQITADRPQTFNGSVQYTGLTVLLLYEKFQYIRSVALPVTPLGRWGCFDIQFFRCSIFSVFNLLFFDNSSFAVMGGIVVPVGLLMI